MATNSKPSMVGYYDAMNWLFENKPHMMDYIASLGAPKNDLRCDRAMVVAGKDMVPRLYANDEFLQNIGPAQAAGVLVHEWRHVLLNHFGEMLNPKPNWTNSNVLADAHEVVINDNIELNGYQLPQDAVRGDNRGGHFYGYWTTEEAYGPMEEWYKSHQANPESQDAESNEDGENSEEGSGSSSSSTSNSSSSQGSGSAQPSDSSGSGDSSNDETSNPQSADSEQDSGNSSANESHDSSSENGENREGAEGAEAGENASDENPEASKNKDSEKNESLENCNHGAYIEDENGDLREMTEEELQEFIDKLNDLTADAITKSPMPEDEKPTGEMLDKLDSKVAEAIDSDRKQGYSKAGNNNGAVESVLAGGKLSLGWLKLLQRINPDVGKADGGMNAKASYNWARPRRTTSLIRGAMLPSAGDPRGQGIGTKQKPVALIALDFSQSIDRRLAYALKDMAQSIPEEHIEARCITFSTEAVPFDFKAKKNNVASGGTNFKCIELEARKIQAETGEYPYVICLTDGEAWFADGYYYGDRMKSQYEPTKSQLDERWLWVDVLTEDDGKAFKNLKAYPQVKSQKNLSALPYDRSKL